MLTNERQSKTFFLLLLYNNLEPIFGLEKSGPNSKASPNLATLNQYKVATKVFCFVDICGNLSFYITDI